MQYTDAICDSLSENYFLFFIQIVYQGGIDSKSSFAVSVELS